MNTRDKALLETILNLHLSEVQNSGCDDWRPPSDWSAEKIKEFNTEVYDYHNFYIEDEIREFDVSSYSMVLEYLKGKFEEDEPTEE